MAEHKDREIGTGPPRHAPGETAAGRLIARISASTRAFAVARGFDYYVVTFRIPKPKGQVSHFGLTNYPQQWLHEYVERGYVSIDPIYLRMATGLAPFSWSSLRQGGAAAKFFQRAARHGLIDGVCVPLHGPNRAIACFSLVRSDDIGATEMEALLPEAMIYAARTFESVLRFFGADWVKGIEAGLSVRQAEVLTLMAQGHSVRFIAQQLRLEPTSVRTHCEGALHKLGVETREEAIAKAIVLGLIDPLGSTRVSGDHDAASGATELGDKEPRA